MTAFDSLSFDPASFDVAAETVSTGTASVGLSISIVNPLIFSSSTGYIKWSPVVVIGSEDLSARLTGLLSVTGAEDSARVASLSLIPSSVSQMESLEGQFITIDVVLFRTGQTATYRIFTGTVERYEFDPISRVVSVSCRDGWQERPLSCATANDVESLLGGLVYPSTYLLPWSDAEPDPSAYFSGLIQTLPGATAIDSNGLWNVIKWDIGTPDASFAAGDIFDGSLSVLTSARADVPMAITASLALRYSRLHSAEVDLSWDAVENVRYVVDGLPTLPKSTVIAALEGVSDWFIKGEASIVEPIPGVYTLSIGGQPAYFIVTPENARTTCQSFTATMYRRWYQQVETTYSVNIPMGGSSSRDDSIVASIVSSFDHSAWERAQSSAQVTSIYSANPPDPPVIPLTGYEGLPLPYPPTNGAIDYLEDIDPTDFADAINHVIAKALRKATKGKRQRRVKFSRPLDPRWEIGAVFSITAGGISATGQVSELEHSLDIDTGSIQSTFTLAVPEGSGSATEFTASASLPSNSISHALTDPTLSTHVGASYDTLPDPDEDTLLGFLCNVVPTSDNYDDTAPVYEPQFRVILPEIVEDYRDPLKVDIPVTASVTISSGSLEITF